MQVIFLKEACLLREHGLHQTDSNLGRFLHHITQLSGNGELALSLGSKGFDKEDFSSHRGPSKTCYHPGSSLFFHSSMMKRIHIQIFLKILFPYRNLFALSPYQMYSGNSAKGIQAFFQTSHPAFSGVVGDNAFQSFITKLHIFRLKSYILQSLLHQVPFTDFKFLPGSIALILNHLHTV